MTFDDVMAVTRTVSSPDAFRDEECKAYFDILFPLPAEALIVEIGLQYGRSSSVALQVAKEHQLVYVGIDPFIDPPDAWPMWSLMAHWIGGPYRLFRVQSDAVIFKEAIHCILIDGGHDYDTVYTDCTHFLPWVIRGGYALFHDYGVDISSSVYNAVRDYMDGRQGWTQVDQVGCLGIFQNGQPRGRL